MLRVVYFGTPDFAARVLRRLLDARLEIVAVVSQPPRPVGRSSKPQPSSVAQLASEEALPLFEWESASDHLDELAEFEADLFIVVAFGQFLRKGLRDLPRLDCINLHPSLLPKYRGAAPIQHALIQGERETGVSIMKVVKEMDAGDVILQERVEIGQDETLGHLEERLCALGSDLLVKTVEQFVANGVQYRPQDPSRVSEAPKLRREDGRLGFRRTAKELYNLFRGVTPRPGAWCQVVMRGQEMRMKVLSASFLESTEGVPGEQVAPLVVACGEGALRLERIQLEGRRPMAAEELLRGVSWQEIQFCMEYER